MVSQNYADTLKRIRVSNASQKGLARDGRPFIMHLELELGFKAKYRLDIHLQMFVYGNF